MIPVPLWALLAAALAWAMSSAGAYVAGRTDGSAIEGAAVAREQQIAATATEAATRASAAAIAAIEVKHVTVKQRVETEIRDRTVYRDCQHPDRVLIDINEALTGQPHSQPAGDRQLPAAGSAE